MLLSFFFLLQLGLSPLLFCEDESVEREQENMVLSSLTEELLKNEIDATNKPRLCSLQKGPLGFGFNLDGVSQRPGTFISQVRMKFFTKAKKNKCFIMVEVKIDCASFLLGGFWGPRSGCRITCR